MFFSRVMVSLNVVSALFYFAKFDNLDEPWAGHEGPRLTWTTNVSAYSKEVSTPIGWYWAQWLHVTTDMCAQDRVFTVYKCIPLREWRGERILLIGCGNKPTFSGQYCTYLDNTGAAYRNAHAHPNCFTVNPDIGMNPNVVMAFGHQEYSFLPEACFFEVVFENFFWDTEPPFWYESVMHVLKEGGLVSVVSDSRKYTFAKRTKNRLICLQSSTQLLAWSEFLEASIMQ